MSKFTPAQLSKVGQLFVRTMTDEEVEQALAALDEQKARWAEAERAKMAERLASQPPVVGTEEWETH